MNTQVLLNRFSNEIKSISLFAKRIKFDLNGDITELVRLWINDTKPFYQEENKEQILLLLKSFI